MDTVKDNLFSSVGTKAEKNISTVCIRVKNFYRKNN